MSWQRARQPEQKEARKAAILEAAAALYDQKDFAEISMRGIAQQAGLGKASLYHYFKTKEEVFLALYGQEVDLWLADLENRLSRLRKPTAARVASIFTTVLESRPRFCRLSVLLSSVLEHNLSEQVIVEFKLSLLEPIGQTIGLIQTALPDLTPARANDFVIQHHALIAGLWPIAHPSPEVEKVLQLPEFQPFHVDFFTIFNRTLERLLGSS